jgi:hypothetical protein
MNRKSDWRNVLTTHPLLAAGCEWFGGVPLPFLCACTRKSGVTLKLTFIMKLQMLPSFPLQVGEITVYVLCTINRRFIKLKSRCDFSKSTVIHAGEML